MSITLSTQIRQWIARTFAGALSLPIPLVMLWLSLHDPGIDLPSATTLHLTGSAYTQFFNWDSSRTVLFWEAAARGVLYAVLSSLMATAVGICFVLCAAFWSRRRSTAAAYSLLGLTLLPQTFLVFSILQLSAWLHFSTAHALVLIGSLAFVVTPISCWGLWLSIGADVPRLVLDLAADSARFTLFARILSGTFARRAVLIFFVTLALGLGNFVIPYSLGDNGTYTGLVFLQSFSSNLGRDWPTISAAGIILLVPTLAISAATGCSIARTVTRDDSIHE